MLKSKILVNKEVATSFGVIKFNELGECAELTVEQQEHLGTKIPYIQYIPEAPKKEPKESKEPKETESKKAPAKKAPAKKATAKDKKDKE
nr:MAG TPA: hypothetical protein [Herelleviridae sp.]